MAIVWLNGTFGAGKTTTARALEAIWPNSRQFDPEWVGEALSANLRDIEFDNFQDLPPWRPAVVEMLDGVARLTGQNVISVQTVMKSEYWIEIKRGLEARGQRVVHVVLDSDESILEQRINADQEERDAREWRLRHIPIYLQQREWMLREADVVARTSAGTPDEVAMEIVRAASLQ
jgi:chloramphenicol 3-O-phosphotransferase